MGKEQDGLLAVCAACSCMVEDWRLIPGTELSADTRAAILGASLQLDDGLRVGSFTQKQKNIEKYRSLLSQYAGIEGLPASYVTCRAFCALAIQHMDWDGSTISNILGSVSDFHETMSTLGMGVPNPLKTKAGRRLINRMEVDYKKASRAKLSFSVAQITRMLHAGYNSFGLEKPGEKPGGDWGSQRRAKLRTNYHHRMCLTFLVIGLLRMNAASALKVYYRINPNVPPGHVDSIQFLEGSDVIIKFDTQTGIHYIEVNVEADKNVNARKRRFAFIPEEIIALGLHPVRDLIHYLTYYYTPTGDHGNYLFRAPNGGRWQWTKKSFTNKGNVGGFTAWGGVVKAMYQYAFPSASDVKDFGSHSGRKTMAQWLWDDGYPRRLIADMGGWFIKRDAIDLYFTTGRSVILKAAMFIGLNLSGRMHDD